MVNNMPFTPEEQQEVDKIVNQRIDQFKAEQESRNIAIKALRSGGQIINGIEEELFNLLEHQGVLVQENGKFLIRGKDKYGFPQREEIAKALPNLLKNRYSHYAAEENTSVKSQSDKVEGLTTQALYKMVQEGDSSLDKVFEQAREIYS